MHFNLGKRNYAKNKYAPTERCAWRKRVLQGEVHDENAFALGGIAPHAGLFGRIEDVSQWALEIRKALNGQSTMCEKKWLQKFVRRQIPAKQGDWGWLYMKPTRGQASCGRYFSSSSFGHTGFTGTSLWFDPKKDLIVVVLSNRVHPTRQNRAFVTLRPMIHDWVVQALKG